MTITREANGIVLSETDHRFYCAPSAIPGAGMGLYSKVSLAMGDELLVVGFLVASGSVQDKCTRYADAYKFRVGDNLLIPCGYAGMVNHSSQIPNMEKVIVGDTVYLRTLRPIGANEELLYCYSSYAQERFQLTG
jgi:SET domain